MLSKFPREVTLIVVAFLSIEDIRSCSNVCRNWAHIFEQFRWNHVMTDLSKVIGLQEEEKTYWKACGSRSEYLLLNYTSDYIKNIGVHFRNVLDLQCYFPNIKTLRFHFYEKCIPVVIFAKHGHNWSSLTCLDLRYFGDSYSFSSKEFIRLFYSFPFLKRLELKRINIDHNILLNPDEQTVPVHLESLQIKGGIIPYRFSQYCAKKFPSLRSISLETIDSASLSNPFTFAINEILNFWVPKYRTHLETGDIQTKDGDGGNIFRVAWNQCNQFSFPTKHLLLTISVDIEKRELIKEILAGIMYHVKLSLITLSVNLSNPLGNQCLLFSLPYTPCLRDLSVRYLDGAVNFALVISCAPCLKRAMFEIRLMLFEDYDGVPHGLESIELCGLWITSKTLDNISSACSQVKTINISPTVKIY
ncbi:hypothetical protein CLU79DRAFT_778570 [Phycomyces nitens]|nr:hypothetical protein CLU79DRAFT_778570 [Phycomyces nitens]